MIYFIDSLGFYLIEVEVLVLGVVDIKLGKKIGSEWRWVDNGSYCWIELGNWRC